MIIAPAIAHRADTKNANVMKGHVINGFLHFITQNPHSPIKIATPPPTKQASAIPLV
jgi:hypothetical protein